MAPLVWLVTGCSSGFGEAFVRQIQERGDKVIATARRIESIAHFKTMGVAIMKLDVIDDQESINETISEAIAIHGHIDVLVNNAAYIATGSWEDVSEEEFRANFDTNVFGVIKVTKAILPHFRKRRAGTNVFISSRSGWSGDAFVGPYAGTKFALEGIVESLWRETEPLGLRTLLIEPGRFRTLLLSPNNVKLKESTIQDYVDASKEFNAHITSEDRKQSGDVEKGVSIIVDLVRNEGVAVGKKIPFRLPIGSDCYDTVKEKCEETLRILAEWNEVANSTNHAD